MIIVSFGINKSGSTLAFEMTKAILELNGFPQARLDDHLLGTRWHHINFAPEWTDARLRSLIEAANGTRIVVKTHAGPAAISSNLIVDSIEANELRVHVVYRDPRDTVLSMLDAGFRARRSGGRGPSAIRALDDAIERIGERLEGLRQWGSFRSLKLCYEDFAFDGPAGPTVIAEDLGLEVDPPEVWEIVNQAFTQKNVARPERYKTELSLDEIVRIERAFPLYLEVVRGNPPVGWFARPD